MAFIGNKDVDRIVLLQLGDSDLLNICQVNEYFKSLCSDELWKIKTLEKFGLYLGNVTRIVKYMKEYDFKTWKSYYISLAKFLEGKYLGYTPLGIREDILRLDNYIERNTNRLLGDINDFLENEISLENFMDKALEDDMINPNKIFENLFTYEYEKISKFAEPLLEYMLNSKDKRIHPEYLSDELLENLTKHEDTQNGEGKMFQMVLRDLRVNPNILLQTYESFLNLHKFASLLLSDPRVKLDTIKELIEDCIRHEMDAVDFVLLSEAFLNKGGSPVELLKILDKIKYYNKRSFHILQQFVTNFE
jgi:hypothetical protein